MSVITTNESIDYNVLSTDRGSANAEVVRPAADQNFANLDNHIPDDLGGYEGKSGTTVRGGNVPNTINGETLQPDRYILTDAGEGVDVKRLTRVSDNNPHVVVMDHVNKNDPQFSRDWKKNPEFKSFLLEDADEATWQATSIAGLRTALVEEGDTRWTSDKMLGRKDRNGKYIYVDKHTNADGDVWYTLKLQYSVSHSVRNTMPTKAMAAKIAPYHTSQYIDIM